MLINASVGSRLVTKRSGDRGHSEDTVASCVPVFPALMFHPLPETVMQLMNGKLPG